MVLKKEDDSWYVVCAACCHMVLVFAMMHLCIYFVVVLFGSIFSSFFLSLFDLVLTNQIEGLMMKGLTY